ncbi:MAG: integration host factor subunit alpha [Hyphomicrobiaceae bacterium]|nr:integration host factor subunit alpha [Hyphomicrobiaceae bacterium]
MAGKTLTRADLADAVVRKVGLPRNESQDLVELILDEISITLASGDSVKLSSFGSFGIREKGQRVGRNPKTGKEVPITPRRVLVFRPSNVMKERINAGAKKSKTDAAEAKSARKATKSSASEKEPGGKTAAVLAAKPAAAAKAPSPKSNTKSPAKVATERQA